MSARKKIQRFELLVKLAERKRKEAERLLAETQQRVRQAETGLQQLKTYQLEYQQQFTQAGQGGLSAGQVQTHQAFIGRLNGAQQQQQEALVQSRAQLEQVENYWRQALAHQKAMQKLLDKAVEELARFEDKRDQQLLDERAQHTRPTFI
ncbi:MAG: flagellar export protein FliJ [Oceanospirillaceae bacterium]|nr:flagellar export protein FliJ [Oceanospirillaceae bacterium]